MRYEPSCVIAMQVLKLTNESRKLCIYWKNTRGAVQDCDNSFNQEMDDIPMKVGKLWFVSKVDWALSKLHDESETHCTSLYSSLNDQHEEVDQKDYLLSSHQLEKVTNVHEFHNRYLMKISSQIDTFIKTVVNESSITSNKFILISSFYVSEQWFSSIYDQEVVLYFFTARCA